ncbi:hypothetical protein SGFS_034160 [Streptomyces graminofaciens]|uniref:Beta-lactamase-related domain-containing protein n=1 Tax=Streptomyces graminofaciens TaxID=68212 RepID=A0ABN5VFT5_9ACTN|nr:serine hydrolase domain-containing protein [Streptomyces graminofaciens]BBC32122.1 hypothetical protein SGFS_034160 [Streptomyces graminofaciens]
MTRTRTASLCAAALLIASLQTTATATAMPAPTSVPRHEQRCTSIPGKPRGEAHQVMDVVREARRGLDLKEVLVRVTTGGRKAVTGAAFLTELYAHPFRQWTPRELVAHPLRHPLRHALRYRPGINWSCSHADFVLLGIALLEKITGTPLEQFLREHVMDPLDLREPRNGFTPEIPQPVLHAYDAERGLHEESPYGNPSWSTAPGAVLTGDIYGWVFQNNTAETITNRVPAALAPDRPLGG